ncbi:MAG: hypothetical protein HY700_02715 [Gemmatimonadetes bacterium]|nr:hypothetical protein [Gemmatimonadota bacterium]
MNDIIEVRAIVRLEMLDRLVHCLKEAGVPRLAVAKVHAIGAGVDVASAKVSLEEGTAYVDKALVQFICPAERQDMYTELIARTARTGRQGDGYVAVYPVLDVVKIRTGTVGLAALR